MAVVGQALADDPAIESAQRREQRGGAVALIAMGHGAGATGLHRQARLGAIERLDLALLIDAEDERLLGRVDPVFCGRSPSTSCSYAASQCGRQSGDVSRGWQECTVLHVCHSVESHQHGNSE